jgi:hypothetical protein
MTRVGQNHMYSVNIRYFWQGNHQIYGHIRCIYTVLANPTNDPCTHAAHVRHHLFCWLAAPAPSGIPTVYITCTKHTHPHSHSHTKQANILFGLQLLLPQLHRLMFPIVHLRTTRAQTHTPFQRWLLQLLLPQLHRLVYQVYTLGGYDDTAKTVDPVVAAGGSGAER